LLRKLLGQLELFFNPGAADAAALRSIVLLGRPVSYRFERRRRRTLCAMVDGRGLRVVAPMRLPLREVEAFLQAKAGWITKKLEQWAPPSQPGKSLPLGEAERQAFLQRMTARAAHYAALLGLPPPPVKLSNARTRWGACSARGRIRLSWRLAHLEPALADYVVAHEVAHLKELNHSRRFWNLLETLYPDCRSARARIRRAAVTIPQI
jgi:predicted metal-dependent hydrolase